jgi:hypothetical protein
MAATQLCPVMSWPARGGRAAVSECSQMLSLQAGQLLTAATVQQQTSKNCLHAVTCQTQQAIDGCQTDLFGLPLPPLLLYCCAGMALVKLMS